MADMLAAEHHDGWKIRSFDLMDPSQTLALETFETEIEARLAFDLRADRAREHGGGCDLIHNHERIARVMCRARTE